MKSGKVTRPPTFSPTPSFSAARTNRIPVIHHFTRSDPFNEYFPGFVILAVERLRAHCFPLLSVLSRNFFFFNTFAFPLLRIGYFSLQEVSREKSKDRSRDDLYFSYKKFSVQLFRQVYYYRCNHCMTLFQCRSITDNIN